MPDDGLAEQGAIKLQFHMFRGMALEQCVLNIVFIVCHCLI
jgi:hypothetical protein